MREQLGTSLAMPQPGWGRPEVEPHRPPALGRYAVLGLLALALSLAGVMGGHHLLGQIFGPEDGDEAVASASAREESPECPPTLRATDACDFDGDPRSPLPPPPPAPTPEKE